MMFGKKLKHVCNHNWEFVGASYLGPRTSFEASGFVSEHYVRIAMEGMTTVTQKCTVCNYVDSQQHYGRLSIPGYTWTK